MYSNFQPYVKSSNILIGLLLSADGYYRQRVCKTAEVIPETDDHGGGLYVLCVFICDC